MISLRPNWAEKSHTSWLIFIEQNCGPHISAEGCSLPQKAGRAGVPNTLQRNSSSSCTHATPAGLTFGMPGKGEVMEGEVQQVM